MNRSRNMSDNVVVLDKGTDAEVLAVTDTLWDKIDARYGDFANRLLISRFTFDKDWPTWEIHPAGDEFVFLLSGAAELVLATLDGEQTVLLKTPGDFEIVPANTWHTARVSEPTAMLFVTPGEGTANAESPPGEQQ